MSSSINTSYDPCGNFYEYACGNSRSPDIFNLTRVKTNAKLIEALDGMKKPSSKAVNKLLTFYNACKRTLSNLTSGVKDAKMIQEKVNAFKRETGLEFTWFSCNSSQSVKLPSRQTLAKALAYLSVAEDIQTLITTDIAEEWQPPKQGPRRFKLFIYENTLIEAKYIYQTPAFKILRDNYEEGITRVLRKYATTVQLNLSNATLTSFAKRLVDFELTLANTTYSYPALTPLNFSSLHNVYTVNRASAEFDFIDMSAYLKHMFVYADQKRLLPQKPDQYEIIVPGPARIRRLSKDIVAKRLDAETIVNYLFFRILYQHAQRIPQPAGSPTVKNETSDECIFHAKQAGFGLVLGRVLADALYPTPKTKKRVIDTTMRMTHNIRMSYRSMIDHLDWMDAATKKAAYAKVDDLQVNIGYPAVTFNDSALDARFAELNWKDSDSFFAMVDKATKFSTNKAFAKLGPTAKFSRSEWGDHARSNPAYVNAWYIAGANSINIPIAILHAQFFNADWPAYINYAIMGNVVGHELGHGFDDHGVQWNSVGALQPWMTKKSSAAFNKTVSCIAKQYDRYCPLNATQFQPNCIDGTQTAGENIADNAGLHAAFSAYRLVAAVSDPEPLLPDPRLSRFTRDQLFFLSYAQNWCSKMSDEDQFLRLVTDSHSPYRYRVTGPLRNYPAFRTAFNCPAINEETCHVYTPKMS